MFQTLPRLGSLLLFLLLITSCAPAAPGAAPAVDAPTVDTGASEQKPSDENSPWSDPYEKVRPELCPPDGESNQQPVFGEFREAIFQDGQQTKNVFVRDGIADNEQGELFWLRVTGLTQEAIREYTDNLKLCFDLIYTGEETETAAVDLIAIPESIELFTNDEDLMIEIYLLGFSKDSSTSKDDIQLLIQEPRAAWDEILRERQLLPEQARKEFFGQDMVIDFVIDPKVKNSATHNYPQVNAAKVTVTITVGTSSGSGTVDDALCRRLQGVSQLAGSGAIAHGGTPEANTLSHDGGNQQSAYDFRVRGTTEGTYRTSGRWEWSRSFQAGAPQDNTWLCS